MTPPTIEALKISASLLGPLIALLVGFLLLRKTEAIKAEALKGLETFKIEAQARLDSFKSENIERIEGFKMSLAAFARDLDLRKQELVKLANSMGAACAAAQRLAESAATSGRAALLKDAATSLVAIAGFVALAGETQTRLYLTEQESSAMNTLVERLTELFLSLDFDAGARDGRETYARLLGEKADAVTAARDELQTLMSRVFDWNKPEPMPARTT
jgi:hypothetical protein